jgi:hypothetical protein
VWIPSIRVRLASCIVTAVWADYAASTPVGIASALCRAGRSGVRAQVANSDWVDVRVQAAQAACRQALAEGELERAVDFLARFTGDPRRGLELLRETARTERPAPGLAAARDAARRQGGPLATPALIERALLVQAAAAALARIASLPVDDSVKGLLCREFTAYASPPPGTASRFALDSRSFVAMARIAFGLRYPAGVFDWEASGFPRRWLLKIPRAFWRETAAFLIGDSRGLAPFLVWHMAGTLHQQRFLLESEVNKSFFRMAAAAERQPQVKALMAASWLVSRETHRISPHLQFVSRPFLEAGGTYTEAGPADVSNGFLTGDARRRRLYESGEYRPAIGVVLCSRDQAIRWKAAHADLEPQVLEAAGPDPLPARPGVRPATSPPA